MKRTIASRIHTAAAAVTECVLYILTGAGLLYVPAVCIMMITAIMQLLGAEPILLETWVLCIGAAGCAGAAFLSSAACGISFGAGPSSCC